MRSSSGWRPEPTLPGTRRSAPPGTGTESGARCGHFWKTVEKQYAAERRWRRRRDSNPRGSFPPTPLAGERLRPLGHVSADLSNGGIHDRQPRFVFHRRIRLLRLRVVRRPVLTGTAAGEMVCPVSESSAKGGRGGVEQDRPDGHGLSESPSGSSGRVTVPQWIES